jgi:hypothetical protein
MFFFLLIYMLIQKLNSLMRPFKQSLANMYINSPTIQKTNYLLQTTCSTNYLFYQLLVMFSIS